ncbi:MAG TPA: 1-(5-phosphoribosyl)-5-[(5-phosphoribosylamino)methylideneamino]imidazole-4-carboxamide isomerase [Candidatus Sulfomarinibacteraceae bacterium]|nr:1-(5-phosphoribosyl)-5-[(5-phosphoribosylamino)methylideneamino]imidazole-4-carboxamide isomerase [Candidatus Sulfomarinibacteraceae bacterium]
MSEPFTIFPAVDLREGRVVRLKLGDPHQQTGFGDEPLAAARRWVAAGARWLHVINLDGAFDEGGAANWRALPGLSQLGAHVQFGGGVRALDDIARALEAGAQRVILGTAAVENPDLVVQAIEHFGAQHIVVAIDAREGMVRTRGWQKDSGLSAEALGQQMKALGVETVLHTDIGRDGVLSGVNAAASAQLAQKSGLRVIASGGVASLEDIRRVLEHADKGLAGVITGRALYEGRLDLAEALALAQEKAPQVGQNNEDTGVM